MIAALALISISTLKGSPDGYIDELSGEVWLARGKQPQKRLAAKHQYMLLAAKDVIRTGKGTCTILLASGDEEVVRARSSFKVPARVQGSPPDKSVSGLGRPAGEKLAAGWCALYSPADGYTIRPGHGRLLWEPVAGSLNFKLNGAPLLTANGETGAAAGDEFQKALARLQQPTKLARASLEVSSDQRRLVSLFYVMSRKESKEVLAQLAKADSIKHSPFKRACYRADVFVEHELFNEAVEEYLMCLKLAPKSEHVRNLCRSWLKYIGNSQRAKSIPQ